VALAAKASAAGSGRTECGRGDAGSAIDTYETFNRREEDTVSYRAARLS
jgi:hypothetical protein